MESAKELLSLVDLRVIESIQDPDDHSQCEFYNHCHGADGKFCDTGGPGNLRDSDGGVSGKLEVTGGEIRTGKRGGSLVDPHIGTATFDGVQGYDKTPGKGFGKPVPGTDAWLENHGMSRPIFNSRPYVKFEANADDPALNEAFADYPEAKKLWRKWAVQKGQTGGYIMYKHEVPGSPWGKVAPQVRPNVDVATHAARKDYAAKVVETSKERLALLKNTTPASLKKERMEQLRKEQLHLERTKTATPEKIKAEAEKNLAKAKDNVIKAKASGDSVALIESKNEYVKAKRQYDKDIKSIQPHNWNHDKLIYFAEQRVKYAQNRLDRVVADPKGALADEVARQERTLVRDEKRYKKTSSKYLFSPKTVSARIDMNQDPQNVKNLAGKGRIYFAMEGSIKADAILTSLKKEDPTATVVNVPSVTLWQQKPGASGLPGSVAGEIAWFAHNHAKGREVVLIPDSDGINNPNVKMQAKALATSLKNNGAGSVIIAPPPLRYGTKKQIDKITLPSGAPEERKGIDDHLGAGRGQLSQLQYTKVLKMPKFDLSEYTVEKGATGTKKINKSAIPNAQATLAAISGIVGPEGVSKIPAKMLAQTAGLSKSSAIDSRDKILDKKLGLIKVEFVFDQKALATGRRIRNPDISEARVKELVKRNIIKEPNLEKEYTDSNLDESPVVTILDKRFIIKPEHVQTGVLADLPTWNPPKTYKGWTSSITSRPDTTGVAQRLNDEAGKIIAKKVAQNPPLKKAPPGQRLVRTDAGSRRYGVPKGQPIPMSLLTDFNQTDTLLSMRMEDMRTCSIEGCDNKHKGLGYCVKHYERFKTYGDPLIAKISHFEWLTEQLSLDMGDTCKEWPFGILTGDHYGYGVVKYNNNNRRVQRVVFELVNGPIEEGLVVTNICDNILCFNPNHLQEENRSRTSRSSKKTHCLNGHPLEGDNLRNLSNGDRCCKICSNVRVNFNHKTRRAAKTGSMATLTNEEWEEILSDFDGNCAYCGNVAAGQDHVIPLSRGGPHSAENIVPACTTCNSSKSNQTIEEWINRRQNSLDRITSLVLLNSKAMEEFYNKCHGKGGKFCATDGSGEGVSGKATVNDSTWPPSKGRPITTVAESKFGSVTVNGIKAKAVYEITANNGNKVRLYDKTGKAGPYKDAFLQNHARMNEMYPLKPPRNIVVTNPSKGSILGENDTSAVNSNHNETYINSRFLGLDLKVIRPGYLMPSAHTGNTKNMDYLLTHEYGHQLDFSKHVQGDTHTPSALFKDPVFRKSLSKYGQKSAIEAYAETFAEWNYSRGRTKNPAAIAMARYEGWHGAGNVTASIPIKDFDNSWLFRLELANPVQFQINNEDDINSDLPKLGDGITVVDNLKDGPRIISKHTEVEPTEEEIAKATQIMKDVFKELNLNYEDASKETE